MKGQGSWLDWRWKGFGKARFPDSLTMRAPFFGLSCYRKVVGSAGERRRPESPGIASARSTWDSTRFSPRPNIGLVHKAPPTPFLGLPSSCCSHPLLKWWVKLVVRCPLAEARVGPRNFQASGLAASHDILRTIPLWAARSRGIATSSEPYDAVVIGGGQSHCCQSCIQPHLTER